jgi:CDP-glucose 4,6-dehydratase
MHKFWRDKKVLVTGGAGFIGSWLTKKLIDLGAQVTVLVETRTIPYDLIRNEYEVKVDIVYGLLQDFHLLEQVLDRYKIDTVFHLGAQTQVREAFLQPFNTYESNIRGTYNLLEACRSQSHMIKRIVVASSDKAYGIHDALPYIEATPLRAIYPYDVSKACTDLIALSYYHTYQLPLVVTRCGNVYGGRDFNWDRLIPSVIKSLYDNKKPILRSDGKALRDYVFVEDIVQAYLSIGEQLEKGQLQGEVFNLSTGQPTQVLQIVEMLAKVMRKEHLQPVIENNVQGEIPNQYLSAHKAWEILCWKPYIGLQLGLSMTVDWYEQFFKRERLPIQQQGVAEVTIWQTT